MISYRKNKFSILFFTSIAFLASTSCSYFPNLKQNKIDHQVSNYCQIKDGAPNIFRALCQLERGEGDGTVNIVHLGDSLIVADVFSNTIRSHLQSIWGNAGRGLITPPEAIDWQKAGGIEVITTEGWDKYNSLNTNSLPFGISGVVAESVTSGAEIVLKSNISANRAQVILAPTNESPGALQIKTDISEYVLTSPQKHPVSITLPVGDNPQIQVKSWSTNPVRLTSLGFMQDNPGVRYHSFGVSGARLTLFDKWDKKQIQAELSSIDPDMIILSYGTNDGYDSNLNISNWKKNVTNIVKYYKTIVPLSTILLIAPPDAAVRYDYQGSKSSSSEDKIDAQATAEQSTTEKITTQTNEQNAANKCVILTQDQKNNYKSLIKNQNKLLASWHNPPNIDKVRMALRDIAQETDSLLWDWSSVMGKGCGIHIWSRSTPKLAWDDHVHLTNAGYIISGNIFIKWFVAQYTSWLNNIKSEFKN